MNWTCCGGGCVWRCKENDDTTERDSLCSLDGKNWKCHQDSGQKKEMLADYANQGLQYFRTDISVRDPHAYLGDSRTGT